MVGRALSTNVVKIYTELMVGRALSTNVVKIHSRTDGWQSVINKCCQEPQQNWWLAERYQQMLSRATAELMTERALSNNSKIDCRTRGWRCASQPALKRSTTELVIGRAFSNKRWKDLQRNGSGLDNKCCTDLQQNWRFAGRYQTKCWQDLQLNWRLVER